MRLYIFLVFCFISLTIIIGGCAVPDDGGGTKATPTPVESISAVFDNSDVRYPAQVPPSGLNTAQAPQFVSIGFDDNGFSDGMRWAIDFFADKTNPAGTGNSATYDGDAARVTFFLAAYYASGESGLVGQTWKEAADALHEIGNHTYSHPNGRQNEFSSEEWGVQVDQCTIKLEELGITGSSAGFRTPYLAYNDNLFDLLTEQGYWYDCSIEEGYQDDQDGTNCYWPYTLESGSPGHQVQVEWGEGMKPISGHDGLWEMPVYALMLPPDNKMAEYGLPTDYSMIQKCADLYSWFDASAPKITGFDYNLWYLFKLTKEDVVAILKYNLDLRLASNRAPFLLGAHTDEYSELNTVIDPDGEPLVRGRQEAIEEFITYALSKDDVRVVPYKKILDWIRNPVALAGN